MSGSRYSKSHEPFHITPQDALQDYFDDLLGVGLPEKPAQVAAPVPAPLPFAEPVPAVSEHRARLEKLLQSARPQAVPAPVPAPAAVVKPAPAPAAVPPPPTRAQLAALERQRQIEAERQADAAMIALNEAAARVAPAPVAAPQKSKVPAPVTAPAVHPVTASATTPAATTVVARKPVAETVAQAPEVAAATAVSDPALLWADNGRPRWAQERFEVLLFEVSGLTLAVPLIALGQIQPLTADLTPLFGQVDWFMGLLSTPLGQIRTVNTAKFVMPERYSERFLETARYVVSINGLPWGLAVDKVNQPITLEPEDVKWRTERSKRPWLAGTVKEHMCVLIDIPMMGHLLQQADANSTQP